MRKNKYAHEWATRAVLVFGPPAAEWATRGLLSIIHRKDRLKAVDETCDKFCKIGERLHDGAALQRHSLAESYVHSRIALICNVEVLVPLKGFGSRVRGDDKPIRNGKLFASLVFSYHSPNPAVLSVCNEEAVFIFDIEVMQGENILPFPPTVGLYDIQYEALDLFAGILFKSSNSSFHSFSGLACRKLPVLGIASYTLKPSVVNCRPQVVDRVPKYNKKSVGKLLSRNDAEAIATSIRICVDVDGVRVSVRKLLSKSSKIIGVL